MNLLRFAAFALAASLAATAAHAQIAFRGAASAGMAAGVNGTVTYIGAAEASGGAGDVDLTIPAAAQEGDLLLAVVAVEDETAGSVTAPGGWIQIRGESAGNHAQITYYRFATANDVATTATWTWDWGGTEDYSAAMLVFRGVDALNPIDVHAGLATNTSNQTTIDIPAVTPTVANTLLVAAVSIRSGSDFGGWSGGLVERTDDRSASGDDEVGHGTATLAGPAAGVSSGTFTVTASNNDTSRVGQLIALRPVVFGPTINLPVGTLAGDVMVASIAVRPDTVAVVAPAGWVALLDTPQAGGSSNRMQTFHKVATGAEPATYTFILSGAATTGAAGGILAFSGVDITSPIDVSGGNATASGTAHTANGISTTVANTMLVGAFEYTSIPSDWSAPAGMTEAVDQGSAARPNGGGIALEMAYAVQAAIGASGNKQATSTPDGGADTGVAHLLALRPVPTVRFEITAGEAALRCAAFPHAINISARDANGNLLPSYAGLVSITTSAGTGDWSVIAASGILTNGAAGDGAATYQFFAADNGAVQLGLAVTSLVSLTVRVQDAVTGFADVSAQIDFVSDGYVIVLDPIQVAGRSQSLVVERRVAPGCGLSTGAGHNAPNAVKVWLSLDASHPAGATLPGATGSTTVDPLPTAEPGANNITLNFSGPGALSGGQAPLTLTTADVGKYVLNVRDTNTARRGSSAAITTRPFALAIRGANSTTAIQHGTTAASPVLAAAGDDFTATVAAYLWQVGDDANDDGVPDGGANVTNNGLAPSYAWVTVLSPSVNLPGVALGALNLGAGSPTVAQASFAGGAATVANLRYSEAGNVFIQAGATNYLASPGVNVTGHSGMDGTGAAGGYTGRFRPMHYALSGGSLTNRQASACAPASGFSYLDETLRLGFTLTAQNAQNATTQNYTGAYAKLDPASFAGFNLGARSGTTNLSSRIDAGSSSAGSWTNGVAGVSIDTGIRRAANPDGPLAALAYGIAPSDADGTAMNLLDLDIDNDAADDRKNLGVSTEVRFGRLRLQNAYGPETVGLQIPMETQYWNGTAFAGNADDSCTTLDREHITLGGYTLNLGACETAVNQASLAFSGGQATLTLAAAGAGNSGTVLLTPNLGAASGMHCPSKGGSEAAATTANRAYLQGKWTGATWDQNPSARAAFGLYGSQPKNFIFFRENY